MYPKFLGQPMYPGGLPVRPENCSYDSKNAKELYWLNSEGKTDKIQDEMLRMYMIYYIGAPLFDNELTQEILEKDLENMTVYELWEELMSCGLDPF